MANLSTIYLGIKLKNPVIVSSSGLTNKKEKIVKLQEYGAGAVVLKSLFEEQIKYEAGSMINHSDYPEAQDYIMAYTRSNSVDQYLKLIEESKKSTDLPIIASINCTTSSEWESYSKSVEEAGADALELNVFFVPTEPKSIGEIYEKVYLDILTSIRKKVNIPVAIKLGMYFTNLPGLINKLKAFGAHGVVLFNRFYAPDIDINSMTFTSSEVFSSAADIRYALRWIGISSALVKKIDYCASTGIHSGESVIKMLLAGATSTQICSVLYKNGPKYITTILKGVEDWMDKNNFDSIEEFRGRLNYENLKDPAVFERAQFMKYFSNMQ